MENKAETSIAAVVIGRNEGARLITCLESLIHDVTDIVYVDSGSKDDSVASAKRLGVHVVCLDMSIPFTAARARNEGANYLIEHIPDLGFIQFVDGDCEIDRDWLEKANAFLNENTDYAVVCGRRRERFPEHSTYNQLCDIEWNTPIGDALACGGDALIRVNAFTKVSGYNDSLIAGEEPEMCYRLRLAGWRIRRIDAEMTLHDAAMTNVGQWWNRAKRAGYAYASSFYLHGRSAEKFKRKEVLSILTWGLFTPIAIVLLSSQNFLCMALFLLYPIQIIRIAYKCYNPRLGVKIALFCALSTVVAKWPQLVGVFKFGFNTFVGKKGSLIEYK